MKRGKEEKRILNAYFNIEKPTQPSNNDKTLYSMSISNLKDNPTFKLNSKNAQFFNTKNRVTPMPLKATKQYIDEVKKMETENRTIKGYAESPLKPQQKSRSFTTTKHDKKGNAEQVFLKTTDAYKCRLCLREHRHTSKIGIEHRSHAISKNKVVYVLEQQSQATPKYQLLKDEAKVKYQLIDEDNADRLPTKEQVKERIQAIQTRNYLRAEKGLIMPNTKKPKPKFWLNFSDYAINLIQKAYNDNATGEYDKPTEYAKNAYLLDIWHERRNEYLNSKKKDIDTLRRIKRLEMLIRANANDSSLTESLAKIKWHLKQSVKDKEHIIGRTQELFRYYELWKLDKRYRHENEYQKAEVCTATTTDNKTFIVSMLYKDTPTNAEQKADKNNIVFDKLLLSVNEAEYLKRIVKGIYATFKNNKGRNNSNITEATIKAISRTLFYKPLRYEEIQALTLYLIRQEAGLNLIAEICEKEGRTEGTQPYKRIRGRKGSTKGRDYTKVFGLCYNWDIQAKHSINQQPKSYKALYC